MLDHRYYRGSPIISMARQTRPSPAFSAEGRLHQTCSHLVHSINTTDGTQVHFTHRDDGGLLTQSLCARRTLECWNVFSS